MYGDKVISGWRSTQKFHALVVARRNVKLESAGNAYCLPAWNSAKIFAGEGCGTQNDYLVERVYAESIILTHQSRYHLIIHPFSFSVP
jgi:hypothetical protein